MTQHKAAPAVGANDHNIEELKDKIKRMKAEPTTQMNEYSLQEHKDKIKREEERLQELIGKSK